MPIIKSTREENETRRIEAFSDAVFAIAITILVLDLKIPKLENSSNNVPLYNLLLNQWPVFLSYLTSFATILIMWVNHHYLFNLIKKINRPFMFLNGLLLLLIAFVPFPTALLAEYIRLPDGKTAAALYAGTYVMIGIAFNLIWFYATSKNKLLYDNVIILEINKINLGYFIGPFFYALAFITSFFNVYASFGITIALAIFYAIAGSFIRIQK